MAYKGSATTYLSNRKQYVSINNSNSFFSDISCGIPQGTILGPILFIIYINDLNSVSQQLRNIMFADDTIYFRQAIVLKQLKV